VGIVLGPGLVETGASPGPASHTGPGGDAQAVAANCGTPLTQGPPVEVQPGNVLPTGAIEARLCDGGMRPRSWYPPLDMLTSNVDDVVHAFNDAPETSIGLCPGSPTEKDFALTLVYPGDRSVELLGDADGCNYVTVQNAEGVTRSAGNQVFQAFNVALTHQRIGQQPPAGLNAPNPRCSAQPGSMPVAQTALRHVEMTFRSAFVCEQAGSGPGATRPGVIAGHLGPRALRVINGDLAEHGIWGAGEPNYGCPLSGTGCGMTTINAVNTWGDVIHLTEIDGPPGRTVFFWYAHHFVWSLSPATAAVVERATGNSRTSY
jgi:hypothetical protein